MIVKFTDQERQQVIKEAQRRQKFNSSRCIRGRNGAPTKGKDALQMHYYGAAGEMAVAKLLNMKEFVFSEEKPVRGSCDLPGGIDVKTRSKHWHSLIVQGDDDHAKIYVLVTIENKIINVNGWITGREAIKRGEWKDPKGGRPAYFVKAEALRSMNELRITAGGEQR